MKTLSGMKTLFGPDQPRELIVRRAVVAVVAGALFLLLIAVPTALIDTPWFGREIPPTWWSWPSVVISSVLAGLLAATYVASPDRDALSSDTAETVPRQGIAGGTLMFFAVGCPVCNKLVLLMLGSAGAMTWWAPVQPFLVFASVAALLWALRTRLVNQLECSLPAARVGS